MAETVRSLLTRSLRLINEPGRGATLLSPDINAAFDVLKDIVSSEGVSRNFKPGVTRHFFNISAQTPSYSYGPGGDFDTDLFAGLVPSKVEDAYIRQGGAITNNQKVINGNFGDGSNDWTLGAGWSVLNGVALFDQSVGDGNLTPSAAITATIGKIYILSFDAVIDKAGINVSADGGAFTTDVNGSGSYSFEFTATVTSQALTFSSVNSALDKGQLDNISFIEKGKSTVELLLGGSDYYVKVMDQKTYNRQFSKSSGGRPDWLFFSRNYPLAEVVFDRSPTIGEILVMDVTEDFSLSSLDSLIPVHDSSFKFLRYQVASDVAPEYGKALSRDQAKTLKDAKSDMLAGNSRKNVSRVDRSLRTTRRRYNINQGDF